MNNKSIVSGVMVLAALCGSSAMAQNFANGDLIAALGNGSPGGGATDPFHYDLLVDLGPISQFQFTSVPQGTTYTYDLSAVLTSAFGSSTVNSGIYWTVFGVNDTTAGSYNSSVTQSSYSTVWTSLARFNPSIKTVTPHVSGNSDSQALALSDVQTIVNLNNPSQAGAGLIVSLANVGSSSAVKVRADLGGFTDTIGSDGNLNGDWGNNILNIGVGTSDLYQSNPGNSITDNQIYYGNVALNSAGLLTVTTVPEPSTWAVLGIGFFGLFAIRRFQHRNTKTSVK